MDRKTNGSAAPKKELTATATESPQLLLVQHIAASNRKEAVCVTSCFFSRSPPHSTWLYPIADGESISSQNRNSKRGTCLAEKTSPVE